MKKNYQEPALRVVKLQHKNCILSGSPKVTGINSGDVFSNEAPTGGHGTARGREFGYDEDE